MILSWIQLWIERNAHIKQERNTEINRSDESARIRIQIADRRSYRLKNVNIKGQIDESANKETSESSHKNKKRAARRRPVRLEYLET